MCADGDKRRTGLGLWNDPSWHQNGMVGRSRFETNRSPRNPGAVSGRSAPHSSICRGVGLSDVIARFAEITHLTAGLIRKPASLFRTRIFGRKKRSGADRGRKDRPCAIVLAVDHPDPNADRRKQVEVAPITHRRPDDPNVAVDVPLRVKEHPRSDSERFWVILGEGQYIHLAWLRPAPDQERSEPG
jgi:hypothetical protein